MNYYPPVFFDEGENTTGFFTMSQPDTLVLFVHGFKGSSTGTWLDFPEIIENDLDFANVDVIFYGYKSLQGQVFDQGREFYNFLNSYFSSKAYHILRETLPVYKKILVVAHSLGAIVSRYALLEAIRNKILWRDKCRLALFAPAHNGARAQAAVMASLPSFYKVLGGLGLFFKPIIEDLSPTSTAIRLLKEETLKYENTCESSILSANVVQAKGDLVVHNGPFCYDRFFSGSPLQRKHTDICNPRIPDYITPLDYVKQML